MTRRLTIFTDMDEVLAQLMDRWLELYNTDYDDDKQIHEILGWNIERWVKPECGKSIYDYLSLSKFFYELQPYEGAVEAMEELHSKHDLYILTATPVNAPEAFGDKLRWVERHLPFFSTDRVISCHNKQLLDGHMLIDDGAHNLRDFTGYAVRMERPWNLGEDCFDESVKDWKGVRNMVKMMECSDKYRDLIQLNWEVRMEKLNA